MSVKDRVLFVCVHNSARSQMAEEYLRKFGGDRFEVESAGLEPGEINPVVAQVLREEGIEIGGKKTNAVFDFFRQGRLYRYVIAVCSKDAADRCPVFPGYGVQRLHWPFDDPSKVAGTAEEKLEQVRRIRDQIRDRVLEFVKESGLAMP